jgi:hypothetical protein
MKANSSLPCLHGPELFQHSLGSDLPTVSGTLAPVYERQAVQEKLKALRLTLLVLVFSVGLKVMMG